MSDKDIIIFQVLCILLFNCSSNSECPTNNYPDLAYETISTDISLQFSDQYEHAITRVKYFNDSAYYFGLDAENHILDIYNLDSKTKVKSIKIDNQGPNAISFGGHTSFEVIGWDSIFFLSDIKVAYLFGFDGDVTYTWDFNDSLSYESATGKFLFMTLGVPNMIMLPMVYCSLSKSMFIYIYRESNYYEGMHILEKYGREALIRIPLFGKGKSEFLARYPFKNTKKSSITYSVFNHFDVDENGRVLFQLEGSDQLLIGDQVICAKSNFSKGKRYKLRLNESLSEKQELMIFNTHEAYRSIHYDPYRKLIYRVFQHEQEEKDEKGLLNEKLQANFSIIILDLEGNIIGESRFPNNKYNFINMHVLKDGLLISRENPYNPDNNEEIYEFDLIQFKI